MSIGTGLYMYDVVKRSQWLSHLLMSFLSFREPGLPWSESCREGFSEKNYVCVDFICRNEFDRTNDRIW